MNTITDFRRDIKGIKKEAEFLKEKGYSIISKTESLINYSNKEYILTINYDKITNTSNIFIRFIKENNVFSVGWIAFIRGEVLTNPEEKYKKTIDLLNYIKKNYDKITNIEYCLESREMIEEYMKDKI